MEEIIRVNKLSKSFRSYSSQQGKKIFLASLRRKYYTKKALNEMSFSVKKGEIVMLLGENGSGKSTLIKILVGILHPDGGEAKVMGMTPWENRIKLAWRYGMVSGAHNQMMWNLPAIDSFEYAKELYEIPEKEYRERLNYFIKLLDLGDVYRRQVRTLSLGERLKCNFVASVLHMPEVVFMDEATIGMDLSSVINLRKALLDMQKRYKVTFFITTHIVDEIKALAEHVIIIDKGSVVFDSTKSALQKFFGKKKQLEIHFGSKIAVAKYRKYGKIMDAGESHLKIEIDAEKLKDKKIIALLNSEEVLDYNVSEPDLSYILSRFYASKKGR
ncbi:MAG: ATP-binding cassette domain-containing protein [Candidatus Micrarchaeota archaeon]|nr:ATP-binding cassette domain-containing protein [Candidatus Micrarchaeota archaeon]